MPTQLIQDMRVLELIIVIFHFYVTSVTLHKSLCCHFSDLTQKFVLSLRWPYTTVCSQCTRDVNYRASYRSISAGPVIGSGIQGQLSVHFCGASYRFGYTGPVIGPDLQGQLSVQNWGSVIGPFLQSQLSVHIYKASDRFISTGPVIGLRLQGQWSVQIYRASYRSISVSLDTGRFTSQAQMHESQIK